MGLVVLDEIASHLASHTVNVRHFVAEADTIKLVRMFEQLRPESGCDELCLRAELMNHVGDSFSVLGVKSLQTDEFNVNKQLFWNDSNSNIYLIDFVK